MNVIEIKLSDIVPYENNPRNNEKAVDAVAESIKQFGFKQPIIIDADRVIVCGHTRVMAAEKLGMETVPCVVADDLTEEQIRAYRLADNKVAELAGWNDELLAFEMECIKEIDMSLFGFDINTGSNEPGEVVEDDYEEDPPEEPKSKLGEIYQLGRHRLMCGDSTDAESVKKLTGGVACDMLLTDPPYNVNYTGGTKDALKIMNDSMEDSAFRTFLTDAFTSADSALKTGGAFYIWHADSEGFNFRFAVRNAGWKLRQCLVWVKNSIVLGRQDYQCKHEPCLYGWKEGTHYFTDDRTQATVIDDKIDLKKLKKEEMLELLQKIYSDKVPTTVLYEDKPLVNDIHPTMKPIKLMAQLIRNSTEPEQSVLDIFGGSGSTLMACEQLNRTCYTMELDPRYVDCIIDRWEKFTGQKATLLKVKKKK